MNSDQNQIQEKMRELTILWMKAQPMIGVFLATTIRHRHDAEDMLQQVAETVARRFNDFDAEQSFNAWAMGIARNKVGNYIQKCSREKHVFNVELVDLMVVASEKLETELENRKDALGECVKELKGRSQRAIEMRYLREMNTDEIANHLGISSNAVFILLHRIRQALGKCIETRLNSGGEV